MTVSSPTAARSACRVAELLAGGFAGASSWVDYAVAVKPASSTLSCHRRAAAAVS